jgi:hypothetical protein
VRSHTYILELGDIILINNILKLSTSIQNGVVMEFQTKLSFLIIEKKNEFAFVSSYYNSTINVGIFLNENT